MLQNHPQRTDLRIECHLLGVKKSTHKGKYHAWAMEAGAVAIDIKTAFHLG